jgi:hypothetical protein
MRRQRPHAGQVSQDAVHLYAGAIIEGEIALNADPDPLADAVLCGHAGEPGAVRYSQCRILYELFGNDGPLPVAAIRRSARGSCNQVRLLP